MNENGYTNGRFGADRQDKTSFRKSVDVPAYFEKRAFYCRLFGVLLLVWFAPAIFLCMLLVWLTSPGPAIFRQKRLGKDGHIFSVLKIRTMYVDAEHLTGPKLCQPGDSRITPVGRLLRYLHLDELPQLVNVARGEMCLVGPRPERPEIIEQHQLNERVPGFRERTKVLPGVTGLAQINLPADQSPECVVPKVALDLEYIETACQILDLRILLCTAMRMVGIRNGYAVKLFGLNRKVSLGQELPKKRIFGKPGRNRVGTSSRSIVVPKGQPSYSAATDLPLSMSNGSSGACHQSPADMKETDRKGLLPNRPR